MNKFHSSGRRAAALLLSLLLFAALPVAASAATLREMADNGRVRDGAVGDAAGYIGDEHDDNPSGLTGDKDAANAPAVLGDEDSNASVNAWSAVLGILIALSVAAALLLLAWFLFPKKEDFIP